jgi:ABC-type transport system substrate-binding protein
LTRSSVAALTTFLPDEHISGARTAYERFTLYQARAGGPLGFTSGPKIAHFDRVEWLTLDPFSAMGALRSGEIDWWEVPLNDQAEALTHDRDITVVPQYATAMGFLRFNHLHPPFNNVAVRRALLGAVDQAEAMTALAGTDQALWHDGIGLFGAGTPLANDAGIEVLRGQRDYAAVRQALTRGADPYHPAAASGEKAGELLSLARKNTMILRSSQIPTQSCRMPLSIFASNRAPTSNRGHLFRILEPQPKSSGIEPGIVLDER